MADGDQNNNDEYHFADLDVLGTEQETVSLPEDESLEGETTEGVASPPGRGRFSQLDPNVVKMIQKGLIAIGAFLFVLVVYKVISSFFSSDKPKQEIKMAASIEPTPKSAKMPLPVRTTSTTENTQTTPVSTLTSTSTSSRDVTKLKEEQVRIENELSSIRTQMNTITQNMSDMATKMNDVKQTMLVLSERLEQQSNQMGRLQAMSRSRRTASSTPPARRAPVAPKPTYSIQAIIPGRAWLMSSQGKPLTVSKGSVVPGYGTVRLINAEVGRVFTSSGRVIRFSQADS